MPITLPVQAVADNKSFDKVADRAERKFTKAGQDSGKAFTKGLNDAASKADPKAVEKWTKAYDKVADSAGKVRAEEAKLADLRNRGANNARLIAQSEALQRARRAEARATREATNTYRELEQASSGTGIRSAGRDAADNFVSGFTGGSALLRLGSSTGPIGLALTAAAALGFVAGKKLVQQIELGMASLQMKDIFAAKMGVDEATMARYGSAAAKAYTQAWGASVEENLGVVQFAVQGGLINADATEADVQKIIEQIQTVSTVVGEDAQSIARGVRNFVRTGVADSTTEALDLIVAASQKGLNISGDLIDTLEEYGTKFRDVGLSGQDALGLISQMLEGGIRNTDVAADALKEFAITAVDGSKKTAEAFAALGFNADEMAQRFAQGGPVARDALDQVLDALNAIHDPLQQELIGTALFKTKWEDAGDAIKNADLSTAATELGNIDGATQDATDKIDKHASSWNKLGREIDQTFQSFREWLADSAIGRFFNQQLPNFLGNFAGAPQAAFGSTDTYSGQQVNPGIPGAGGSIAPPTGAITGNGTFLDSVLNGVPGAPAPQALDDEAVRRRRQGDIPPPARTTPVPMVPDSAGGAGGSNKPNIPLSQYSLDNIPLGAFQGETGITLPAPMPPTGQGPGYLEVDPGRIFDAESRQLSARQSVESARLRLLELQASNDATESDLQSARNSVIQAERGLISAQQDVAEAQMGTWKKLEAQAQSFADGMGEIGAALDSDFGVSDGLAGIAENITKFFAGLAFAPVVGALRGVQAGVGFPNGSGGSGLAGMIGGALGMGGSAGSGGGGGYSGAYYGAAAAAGGYPGDAALLANVPAGRYTQSERGDLTQGLADCTSAVEDLVNLMDGQPTGGASMWTGNAAEWLTSRGFLPGSMPGAFNVGFNSGHMQATLPGGTPFNWGSPAAAAARGIGGTGAFDPSFTSHYYRPVGAGAPSATSGATPGGYAPLTGSQLTTPSLMTPIPATGGGIGTGAAFPGLGGPPASTISGIAQAGGRGEGGLGIGGGLLGMATNALSAAAGAGGMAANAMAPGAGAAISAAADIGIKLANRATQFAGQAAGIGIGGLLEAFLPVESELADPMNSWFGRIVGGMMGAVPQLPNMAGGKAAQPNNGQQPGQGQNADGKPPITVNYTNNQATEDRAGADLTNHLMAMNSGPGQ